MIDFDAENSEDPGCVSEYVMETFQYYKNREVIYFTILMSADM